MALSWSGPSGRWDGVFGCKLRGGLELSRQETAADGILTPSLVMREFWEGVLSWVSVLPKVEQSDGTFDSIAAVE